MPGELRDGRVVVREQAEANRIFNKGRYGRPLSGGSLDLDLVEAVYLVHQGRLEVRDGKGLLPKDRLVLEAALRDPDFEIRFLAYREFRDGGRVVLPAPPSLRAAGVDFVIPDRADPKRTGIHLTALSERSPARLDSLAALADRAAESQAAALVAVVDEESDVTQYEVVWGEPQGGVAPETRIDAEADLVVDRIIVWDEAAARRLHEREFFGRLVGSQLHLSLVEGIHLAATRALRVRGPEGSKPLAPAQLLKAARRIEPGLELRSRVYEDLKRRRLVPKTGYKFGTHFRAYEKDPDSTHAPYLVHVVPEADALDWPTLSRGVRLAHGVRKTLLVALPGKVGVRYLSLRRAG